MRLRPINPPYGFAIPETQWVFIHITKTGGTSSRRAAKLPQVSKTGHEKHLRVCDFEQAFDSLEGFKFWTVVRNPYDRIRSMWKYRLRKGNYDHSFQDFLRKKAGSKVAPNLGPQSEWIADKEGRPHIHYLMHFENFFRGLEGGGGEEIGVPDLAQNLP